MLSCKEGHLDEARLLCQRAQKRLWTNEHEWTISICNAYILSTTRIRLGDIDEAENLLVKTLKLSEDRLSERHRMIRLCKIILAETLQRRGDYQKARIVKADVLTKTEDVMGFGHPDTILARESLGSCLTFTDELPLAEQTFRSTLCQWEELLGKGHARYYDALRMLGKTLRLQGRYPEAQIFIRNAREGFLKLFGPNHPEAIDCLYEQGLIALLEKRFPDAEMLFKEALMTSRPHSLTIQCAKELATTLFLQSKFGEAAPIFQEALKLSKEICGPEDPTTCDILDRYCWSTECLAGKAIALKYTTAVLDQEDYRRLSMAAKLYEEALDYVESLFGKHSFQMSQILSHVAKEMNKSGFFADAERPYNQSLGIRLILKGEKDLETRRLMHDLGFVLMKFGRLEEADAMLQRANEGDPPPLPHDHHDVFEISLTRAKLHHERNETLLAEDGFLDVLEKKRQSLTGDEFDKPKYDLQISYAYWALGNIYEDRKMLKDAEIHFTQAIRNDDTTSLNKHSLILRRDLGRVLCLRGDHAGSEKILRTILPDIDETFGEIDIISVTATVSLTLAISRQQRHEEALELCEKKFRILRERLGEEDAWTKVMLSHCEGHRELIRRKEAAANVVLEQVGSGVGDEDSVRAEDVD